MEGPASSVTHILPSQGKGTGLAGGGGQPGLVSRPRRELPVTSPQPTPKESSRLSPGTGPQALWDHDPKAKDNKARMHAE